MRLPWDRTVDADHLSPHWFGRMLSALYISTFMIRASFAIMLIAFPVYIIGLKSYFLFGLVLASSPLAELVTVLGLGAYIDKRGRKNVLLMGLLVGAIALFGLLLTKDAAPLFVINAFHGVSAAAILVASLALLADYAPPERRGKVMGAFDFVNIFGWISGFAIGGILIDVYRDDIGMTFVIAGAMGLAAFAWALLNIQEPRAVKHRPSEISFKMIASVLKQRSVVLLIAPWFIIYLLISTMLTFTSKAGTQELGMSGVELGLLLGGGGGVFLVTQVVYGHMSDKYGRTKIMGVGTVGIVGIMLTVGTIFLGAPASVAPAAHQITPINFDDDLQAEYLIQSDFGLYIIDGDGTIIKEIGPPEGGFGRVVMPERIQHVQNDQILLVTEDALEVFSLKTDSILWAEAVVSPRFVHPLDLELDDKVEVLYADDRGIHVSGENVPSTVPAPPPLPPDAELLDLGWYAYGAPPYGIYALYAEGGSSQLALSRGGDQTTVPVPSGFTSINVPGGDFLAVRGSGGVAILNESTGAVEVTYGVPPGWQTGWISTAPPSPGGPGPGLFAWGPSGGSGIWFHTTNRTQPTAELFDLPAGYLVATLHASTNASQPSTAVAGFAALASNGSFVHIEFAFSGETMTTGSAVEGSVLVVRESAQSVFGQLTSLPVAITLGIFALMAGAFGPAALAGLTDVAQEDKRGTTMGLYSVVISSSMIVGPVATGYLVDNYGGFGVMVFLATSAAAMAIFMAIRAWDVRRAGGEKALHQRAVAHRTAADAKEAEEPHSQDPDNADHEAEGELPPEKL